MPAIGDAKILGQLGEGISCVVYDANWQGRNVALKIYKAGAIERHYRLTGIELAEYEFERNKAFWNVPGLRRHVAEPIAYRTSAGISLFVQERLEGDLYYDHYAKSQGRIDPALPEHLHDMVECAHAAHLYDLDLHAGNTMVVSDPESGELIPKLFDFNSIPFYEHPNPGVWVLLKLGLVDRRWRDRRKLAAFHNFRRYRKKIAAFGAADNEAVESPATISQRPQG